MQLNGVVFPAPECSYTIKDFPGELLYIPRNYTYQARKKSRKAIKKTKSYNQIVTNQEYGQHQFKYEASVSESFNINSYNAKSTRQSHRDPIETEHVPCLFLPYYSHNHQLQNQNKSLVETEIGQLTFIQKKLSQKFEEQDHIMHNKNVQLWLQDVLNNLQHRKNSKIMIFFHGNAEDIGLARSTLNSLKQALKISILAVEYSGYGLFLGDKSADKVLTDCLSIYDYVHHEMGVAEQDIILFGRSIGSSPSCFIAKERPEVGSMILMSPFKSLREVAKDHVGKILSYLLAERYRNVDLISHTRCPVLIIHGMGDSIIDVSHAYSLKSNCGSEVCKLITPDEMDHNKFRLQEDVITPCKVFFKENGIKLHKIHASTQQFKLNADLFFVPKSIFDYDFKLQQQKLKPCNIDTQLNKNNKPKQDAGYFKRGSKSLHNQTQVNNSQQVTINDALDENRDNITTHGIQLNSKNKKNQMFKFQNKTSHSRQNTNRVNETDFIDSKNVYDIEKTNTSANWKQLNQYDSFKNQNQRQTLIISKQEPNKKIRTYSQHVRNRERQDQPKQVISRISGRNPKDETCGSEWHTGMEEFSRPRHSEAQHFVEVDTETKNSKVEEFNLESFDRFLNNYEKKINLQTYELNSNNHKRQSKDNIISSYGASQQCSSIKLKPVKVQSEKQTILINQMERNLSTADRERINLPEIHKQKLIHDEDSQLISYQNTDQKSIRYQNQQTPQKILMQNTIPDSFNLSPQSVKQSLPPGESVEGGTTIQNSQSNSNARSMASRFSKMSQNNRKLYVQKYKNQFNQYNYQNQLMYSNTNNQSQSYIDLLNERDNADQTNQQNSHRGVEHRGSKEMEGGIPIEYVENSLIQPEDQNPSCLELESSTEDNLDAYLPYPDENFNLVSHPHNPTTQTEFNQLIISTSEQNDYLYEQLTKKNNYMFMNRFDDQSKNFLTSQINFPNDTEDQIEDLQLENMNDSQRESPHKQQKIEQLEQNVTQAHNYMSSLKTFQTQHSKYEASCMANNCDENLTREIQINNMNVINYSKLMNKVQYRTQKHTQKNSRDFSNNKHKRQGSNNLIKQIREYKAARSIDLKGGPGAISHGRYMSLPCNQLAGIQKIREKKLASPIRYD